MEAEVGCVCEPQGHEGIRWLMHFVCVWTWVWVGGCYVLYLIGVIFNYTALFFSPPLSLLLWVTLCVIFNDSWNKWVVMRWPCRVVCLPHQLLSHSLSLWPEGHGSCVWSSVRMNQLQGKVMKLLVAWRVSAKSLMPLAGSLCWLLNSLCCTCVMRIYCYILLWFSFPVSFGFIY